MREKKRYLAVKGEIGDVEKAVLDGIGVIGMSKTGLGWVKKEKGHAIIYVNRGAVNSVRASFALWPKKLEVEKVSGTLRKLRGLKGKKK